jgi:molecular chaperone GrpE
MNQDDKKNEAQPTPETPPDPKKQLGECQKQRDEYLAGWQRARADFLNYKKEEMERLKSFIDYATEEMILRLLPVLDNLELAEKNLPHDLENNEYVKGLLQVKVQFLDFLKDQGVESIEALGQKFDPQFHEVAAEVEEKGKEPGIVTEEIQKGYLINKRLLRATKVRIAK